MNYWKKGIGEIMELWIRSQDKRHLLEVDKIDWYGGAIYTNDNVNLETTKDGETYLLGRYYTGKRALEVLDEIQSILETNRLFELYSNIGEFPDDFNKKYNYVEVYKMPKE